MPRIKVGDLVIDVVRKDIKNLHIAVYPPDGRVRVSTPRRLDDEAVRLAVISKLPWIRRHQAKFVDQERQSAREFVSGESHYFLGQRYLLNVTYHSAPPRVELRNTKAIDLYVRTGSDTLRRERALLEWYRLQLKALIPPIIAKWEPVIGERVRDWGVKRMKTKWGSCNIEKRRIWLNLELAKKPINCLEFVTVHEMVHFHERLHNDRFVALMDEFMPKWRLYRDELNAAPLGYPSWDY